MAIKKYNVMSDTRKCKQCVEPFSGPAHKLFCSRPCAVKQHNDARPDTSFDRDCKQCGKTFRTTGRKLFCTKSCMTAFHYQKKQAKRPHRICPQCGDVLPVRKSGPTKYCSSECNKAAVAARSKARQVERATGQTCAHCGITFSGGVKRKYCSKKCTADACNKVTHAAAKAERDANRVMLDQCGVCDADFVPMRPFQKYCTETCRRVANAPDRPERSCALCGDPLPADTHGLQRFCPKHTERPSVRRGAQAKMNGGYPQSARFECHDVCDWLRGMGGEFDVDHWIPLILGGNHHPDNCYVLSARDNGEKSAKVPYLDWQPPAAYVDLPSEAETQELLGRAALAPQVKQKLKSCTVCGKFFNPGLTPNKGRCSRECKRLHDLARIAKPRKMVEKVCRHCGSTFKTKWFRHMYCSRKCTALAGYHRRKRVA